MSPLIELALVVTFSVDLSSDLNGNSIRWSIQMDHCRGLPKESSTKRIAPLVSDIGRTTVTDNDLHRLPRVKINENLENRITDLLRPPDFVK
ncbi:hypothetical protein Ciccas_013346 [Cichlidogyrus casuarinus]|uniref:Uncharacterized protein n=1 Tax=Cichlidogyrus casuarinus TaxID=1844966 RepID=A0ABD2PN62_9PLAT